MKFLSALAASLFLAAVSLAGDVELGGMKSKVPAGWKEEPTTSEMRLAQFKLPKADGDDEDAQVIIFTFPAGSSGSADANMKRQLAKFAGKPEVKESKLSVGTVEAPYQDITGTYLQKKRPFDPADKGTEKANFRQIYVVALVPGKGDYYPTLVGPAKTVEKHKKEFEEFLKNFK
jgi:hypothetical protein